VVSIIDFKKSETLVLVKDMLNRGRCSKSTLMATETVARRMDRRFSPTIQKNQCSSALFLRNLRSVFVQLGVDGYKKGETFWNPA
jgi:hypothetical protein